MKRLFYSLLMFSAILVSCQQKEKAKPVDINAEKTAALAMLDKYWNAVVARDVKTALSFLTDDAMILGTDPKEFWTKAQYAEMSEQMLADTSLKLDFKPEKREVYVSPAGNSAVYVEQSWVNFISRKVQSRRIAHLIKVDGNWMVDFDSSSMIPKNEDLPVIDKALE